MVNQVKRCRNPKRNDELQCTIQYYMIDYHIQQSIMHQYEQWSTSEGLW